MPDAAPSKFASEFPPLFGTSSMPTSFDISAIIPVLFLGAFVIWAIFTVVCVYHWFRYAHRSWVTVPVLVVHGIISLSIFIYLLMSVRT